MTEPRGSSKLSAVALLLITTSSLGFRVGGRLGLGYIYRLYCAGFITRAPKNRITTSGTYLIISNPLHPHSTQPENVNHPEC